MAYINSANVKFPKADLIIEEDGTGKVISCYNRTNNTEYANEPLSEVSVTTNNTAAASRSFNYVYLYGGDLRGASKNVAANTSATTSVVKNSLITMSSASCHFETTDPNITLITNRIAKITGAGSVDIVDD